MTESQWLACRETRPMLEYLRSRVSERRLRLFGVACCRRVWSRFARPESRRAVEVAERFADGLASEDERAQAASAARGIDDFDLDFHRAAWRCSILHHDFAHNAVMIAAITASDVGEEQAAQTDLLRELFGNPFRAPKIETGWLQFKDGAALKLARRIHQERCFDVLPILADALEEAGCQDPSLLGHCRDDSEHLPGCWLVELLLEAGLHLEPPDRLH